MAREALVPHEAKQKRGDEERHDHDDEFGHEFRLGLGLEDVAKHGWYILIAEKILRIIQDDAQNQNQPTPPEWW